MSIISKITSLAIAGIVMTAGCQCVLAEEYVVINRNAKVFDTPDATTGYVTLNSRNEEVTLIPGMAFKSMEKSKGWHIVEYSPGLRGYVSELVTAPKCIRPVSGNYNVANKENAILRVIEANGKWSAICDGETFNGKEFGNIVMFFNPDGTPAYSLSDTGTGPTAVTYDNNVTKFF